MKVERKCKIVSKDWLNRDAVYMVLEVGDMVRTSWKSPGQFVHIKCGDSLLLRRPISVCSCMEEEPEDTLAIVFEVRGEGTAWLANRPVGHSVDVMGLLGNGFAMKPEGRYLLVGGGIGVPPIRGCAQYTAKKSTAIVGFRSINSFSDVIFGEMYIVSFERGGDEYLTVKYVNRSEVKGCIKLVSYNPHHDPMDLPLEQINAMAIVKFSIRKNLMM